MSSFDNIEISPPETNAPAPPPETATTNAPTIPPKPTVGAIRSMVERVEARAMASMTADRDGLPEAAYPNKPEWASYDPYFMVHPEDSTEWLMLIAKARTVDADFPCILYYIRGAGTILEKHPTWGYVLKPIIQQGGWESLEHWERDKHLLDKWGMILGTFLKEIGSNIS